MGLSQQLIRPAAITMRRLVGNAPRYKEKSDNKTTNYLRCIQNIAMDNILVSHVQLHPVCPYPGL